MTLEGNCIDSRTSTRLKRLLRVVRSGPMPSPSLPYLWHLRQLAFSKTARPRVTSPIFPFGSLSRNASSSSNFHLDWRSATVTLGRTGSLGKFWVYQRDQAVSSVRQSPSSTLNLSLSLVQ